VHQRERQGEHPGRRARLGRLRCAERAHRRQPAVRHARGASAQERPAALLLLATCDKKHPYENLVCEFENTADTWETGQSIGTLTGKLINGVPTREARVSASPSN
jgi:hypothetical protein